MGNVVLPDDAFGRDEFRRIERRLLRKENASPYNDNSVVNGIVNASETFATGGAISAAPTSGPARQFFAGVTGRALILYTVGFSVPASREARAYPSIDGVYVPGPLVIGSGLGYIGTTGDIAQRYGGVALAVDIPKGLQTARLLYMTIGGACTFFDREIDVIAF